MFLKTVIKCVTKTAIHYYYLYNTKTTKARKYFSIISKVSQGDIFGIQHNLWRLATGQKCLMIIYCQKNTGILPYLLVDKKVGLLIVSFSFFAVWYWRAYNGRGCQLLLDKWLWMFCQNFSLLITKTYMKLSRLCLVESELIDTCACQRQYTVVFNKNTE